MQGARLEVSDAMGRTQVVPIEDDRVTIGRAQSNMLALDGAEISRRHAEIVKERMATSSATSVRAAARSSTTSA